MKVYTVRIIHSDGSGGKVKVGSDYYRGEFPLYSTFESALARCLVEAEKDVEQTNKYQGWHAEMRPIKHQVNGVEEVGYEHRMADVGPRGGKKWRKGTNKWLVVELEVGE